MAGVTAIVWIGLVAVALLRIRRKPVETIANEVPKLIIMGFSAASTVTLAITVVIATVAPQLLQDASAALYTIGWLGAAISLWWAFAVFWREIKLIRGEPAQRPTPGRPQVPVESAEGSAGEVLLPLLRHFVTRWEQFVASENRWMGQHVEDMQEFAKNLSETLLGLDSKYADMWDSGLRNQVKNISNELRQFGVTPIQIISAYDTQEENGKKAYEQAKALVAFLTT